MPQFTPPEPGSRVAVVGGSVIGLACAWRAARAGFDVRVLDPRGDAEDPRAAAWVAGGMLAPFSEAWPGEDDVFALSVASLFFLLAKLILVIMRVCYPVVATACFAVMAALYAASVGGQAGPDRLDPRYPSALPWYLTEGCALAERYGAAEAFETGLASGETTAVKLDAEIPVRLLYHSAVVGPDGRVVLGPDPYGWDARLAQALGLGGEAAGPDGESEAAVELGP